MAAFWPIGTAQIIRIVSYPIRKKSRFWLFCMWSVKEMYHSLLPKAVYRDKGRGHDRRLTAKWLGTYSSVSLSLPRHLIVSGEYMMHQRSSGVKGYMIKCTQYQTTCRRCLVFCLDFANWKKDSVSSRRERNVPHVAFTWDWSASHEVPLERIAERRTKWLSVWENSLGEVSAPSRANYTMRRNADENRVDLPLGVKAVYLLTCEKLLKCGSRWQSYCAMEDSNYTSG